jgi:tryptophan synthase alpha chain
MSRLEKLFNSKQKKILNIYCTAGYPYFDSTMPIIKSLQKNGADIIELGMPYSDPLADGEVIQKSSSVALQNGMTIEKLFEQLKDLRKEINVPVILMGYLNPVLQYGFENFCAKAAEVGIDGLILPDLPMYEFETTYSLIIKKYNLDFIFLITPETSEERVRKLDSLSSGFLYAVSSSSTTGSSSTQNNITAYLQRLKSYNLQNPILVGFGIKDKTSFENACAYSNGAIIGSAYIKALASSINIEETTAHFLHQILD